MYAAQDHTWVICAYRESPFLKDCIESLKAQTVQSGIRMITSTPCDYLDNLAGQYDIPLYVNTGKAGISGDWNFALSQAKTPLVTLAHQDDCYEPVYVQQMLEKVNAARRPIWYFTNYGELRNGKRVCENRLLRIKRIMLWPVRLFPMWKWARRRSLSCGNPICCPSVTYISGIMQDHPFGDHYKSNLDWEQAEILSRLPGSFVYNPHILMFHRIHEESTTSELINQHGRHQEDYEMMCKFWPKGIAKRLSKVYGASENSNKVS